MLNSINLGVSFDLAKIQEEYLALALRRLSRVLQKKGTPLPAAFLNLEILIWTVVSKGVEVGGFGSKISLTTMNEKRRKRLYFHCDGK